MLRKVISGAQVGADIAGLRAAHASGLVTGGWMPKGWRTSNGALPIEDIVRFKLQETSTDRYPERTRLNIEDSDGTIQLACNWKSPGEILTSRLINEYSKPFFQVDIAYDINTNKHYIADVDPDGLKTRVIEWIEENKITTLNVAGNSLQSIEFVVEAFLLDVFRRCRLPSDPQNPTPA